MMPPAAKGLSDRPLETFGFESEEEEAIRRFRFCAGEGGRAIMESK